MQPVRSLISVLVFALASIFTVPASAQNIVGGNTAVTLTSAPTLTSLGLSVAPTGSAKVALNGSGLPVATFPITGGSIDGTTGAALIEHNGSGLQFTSGSNSLSIYDFLINTSTDLVSGGATANGSILGSVPLFSIGSGDSLLLTSQASGAFSSVFGVNIAAGTQIGTAQVNPITAPVPEPKTWLMMLLGFGILGLAIRNKRPNFAAA